MESIVIVDGEVTFVDPEWDTAAASSVLADNVKMFFRDISKMNTLPLHKDEEEALIIAAKNGDSKAQERLFESQIRLVVSIAKTYTERSGSLEFLDLIQEGTLGLLHAIERFDVGKGYRLSTYATYWINKFIRRAIEDTGRLIRLPVWITEANAKICKAEAELASSQTQEPTMAAIAEKVGMPVEKVERVRTAFVAPLSIDMRVGEDKENTLGDLIPDESQEDVVDRLAFEALQTSIMIKMEQLLSEKELFVIRQRFGLDDGVPKSLKEVSKAIGLTVERVRQVEKKALSKLA